MLSSGTVPLSLPATMYGLVAGMVSKSEAFTPGSISFRSNSCQFIGLTKVLCQNIFRSVRNPIIDIECRAWCIEVALVKDKQKLVLVGQTLDSMCRAKVKGSRSADV